MVPRVSFIDGELLFAVEELHMRRGGLCGGSALNWRGGISHFARDGAQDQPKILQLQLSCTTSPKLPLPQQARQSVLRLHLRSEAQGATTRACISCIWSLALGQQSCSEWSVICLGKSTPTAESGIALRMALCSFVHPHGPSSTSTRAG